jgi:hypothetical protein
MNDKSFFDYSMGFLVGILGCLVTFAVIAWANLSSAPRPTPTARPQYLLVVVSTSSISVDFMPYSDLGNAMNAAYNLVPKMTMLELPDNNCAEIQ